MVVLPAPGGACSTAWPGPDRAARTSATHSSTGRSVSGGVRGTAAVSPLRVADQSCGSSANSRLVFRYHFMPERGRFQRPFIAPRRRCASHHPRRPHPSDAGPAA